MDFMYLRHHLLTYLLLCCLAGTSISLQSERIKLHNYSNQAIWLYMKKVGMLGADITVKDLETKVNSGQTVDEAGNITGIWALPFDQNLTLSQFKSKMKKELNNPSDLDKALRKMAGSLNLSAHLGQKNKADWNMSFDIDGTNKPYLYFGAFKLTEPFAIVTTSDKHTIAKSAADLKTMDMQHYGGEEKRAMQLERFMNDIALRDQLLAYIKNPQNMVRAVLYAGDMAGGYGKKSETEAFKAVWWDAIEKVLYSEGGNIFTGIGNHDNYWSSIIEPYPTKSLRFVEDTYGNYLYAYNIGNYRLIQLALRPTLKKNQLPAKSDHPLKTEVPSLTFLADELKKIGNAPAILMFHYPIHGPFSDWWSKAEKNQFYETIKDYNIVLIIVGHAHDMAVYQFRGKCPVVKAGGSAFAVLSFNPQQPMKVDIKFIDKDGKIKPYKVDTTSKEKDINPDVEEAKD